jgi:DNA modification methylase
VIHHGDCLIVLPTLPANSVDACVTDPPYGLAFMGKQWDHGVPNEVCWREVSRVLKPGSYLLAFGGTRTFHRLACALEDAGFEVRDCLSWLYGSGFPKSLNIGGGWGTALKPGWEPIVMARKALRGTVAANVQRFGTGAINVDGCRIEPDASSLRVRHNAGNSGRIPGWATGKRESDSGGSPLGRWPANVVLDEDAAALLDEQTGQLSVTGFRSEESRARWTDGVSPLPGSGQTNAKLTEYPGETGHASRFFYVAKPSREERDLGCDGLPMRSGGDLCDRTDGSAGLNNPRAGAGRSSGGRNTHPTVKPLALMRWLVRLVTPPGGIVLDPFTGSGTTGMACAAENVRFIGIEREAEYVAIAERRIAAIAPLFGEATA